MTSPVSGSSSEPGVLSIPGLVSGIDTTSVINALMQAYTQPQTNLQNQQSALQIQISDYQDINTKLSSLQSAADAINQAKDWQAVTASTSNSSVATATGGSGSTTGSISFTVDQLAAADTWASSGTVSSTSATITTASSLLLSQGGAALGFTSLGAGSGLTTGTHTVQVTQASAAASVTGGSALGASTVIQAGVNDSLAVSVDGVASTLTLAAGTYTPAQLAAAVASASGGSLTASVNTSGALVLSTAEQGSAASLQVTGGSAMGSLGLSAMGSAVTGTDAVVNVDGTSTTLTSLKADSTVSLTSGSGGSISAVLAGGLSLGTVTATNVSTGNGSLASVVAAINNSGTGITASAVQTGTSSYVLQLGAKSTGAAKDLSIDPSAFASSSLGTMHEIVAGADAKLSVGGSSGYTVDSASNTVTGLLPGVSVQLLTTSSSPVTVTSSPDAGTMASKVQSLVSAANAVLSAIQTDSGYNSTTNKAGPLIGSAALSSITQSILSTIAGAVGPAGTNSADAGVSINAKTGQLSFDQTKFTTAFQANPSAVAALFSQSGTLAPTAPATADQVQLLYAPDAAQPGAYDVTVTHSATQATVTGNVLSSGTVAGPENLTVTTGGSSVHYGITAGESLASISAALNAAFASSGLDLVASVINSGQQLQIASSQYGSADSFQVTSDATGLGQTGLAGATGSATATGTDVAGSINGVAATGSGQVLSAPQSDPTLVGLSLLVTAPGITTATSLGTFTYSPGLAGHLGATAWSGSNPVNGWITSAIQGLQQESSNLTQQIAAYNPIIANEKAMLTQQFNAMETQMGTLKDQSNYLASQIAQLPTP